MSNCYMLRFFVQVFFVPVFIFFFEFFFPLFAFCYVFLLDFGYVLLYFDIVILYRTHVDKHVLLVFLFLHFFDLFLIFEPNFFLDFFNSGILHFCDNFCAFNHFVYVFLMPHLWYHFLFYKFLLLLQTQINFLLLFCFPFINFLLLGIIFKR